MSYTRSNATTLVARRGYSDLGATTNCRTSGTMVRGGDGKEYDLKEAASQFPPCESEGTLSKIGSAIKSLFGTAVSTYGSAKTAEGQAAAYQQMLAAQQAKPGMPSWVLPVAIGGAGLIAVVLLTRKK